MRQFRSMLLAWWDSGGSRRFSWRMQQNRIYYATLIAELMLRRTRAEQVDAVFALFIAEHSTLAEALAADPEEIRVRLAPLGLRWRTENLLDLFKDLRERGVTELPHSKHQLIGLPGVGDYVSNAVICFAGGDPTATLVDTNVARVLGRVFGVSARGEARRHKGIRELASIAIDRSRISDYHYAILDFAAAVCAARTPQCHACQFAERQECDYYFALQKSMLGSEPL
ncbi:MAG TPA: hypothetical protein VGK19_04545 [Capsulimonadaceae bacterium]